MFKKVLLPVDIQEPDFAAPAFPLALGHLQPDGELHVLAVLPGYGMPLVAGYFSGGAGKKLREQGERQLQELAAARVGSAAVVVTTALVEGRPYEEIVRYAGRVGAGLIVVPSHNRKGLSGVMLGSCAENVARHAECSVLVIR